MNVPTDFDRALTAWLDEGSRRAPDRPIDLALEHARRRPRRRDPLGFLWPDVMAPQRTGPFARPGLVLALLVLLLVGVVGAAVVGSLRDDPSIFPPGPTPSPTAPSPTPAATPSLPVTFEVTITDDVGNETLVSVVDSSGLIVAAEAAEPGDAVQDEGLELANEAPDVLLVSWVNCPTDSGNVLRIDAAAKAVVLERGRCLGDTIAVSKAVRLTFAQPVTADAVEGTIVDR